MDKKSMMDKMVREAHEKYNFTGTWLFAENGEIVSKGAVGWRDPEDTLPLQEDTIFDLASVSKQFTATAVMILRRRGLIDLEDEIQKFFPEIPYKGIKIRHLLTHTGGLPDYMEWVTKTARAENTIPANDIIVRFLCESGEPAEFAPGEKYEYSNTGYCLLAQIVEKASGVFFDDFLKKEIFEPAGLSSTRIVRRRKDGKAPENYAYGMILEDGKYVLADESKESDFVVPLDGVSGDGLVHSNILDLYKWDRALREGKILTKEEQAMMYTAGRLNNGEIAVDEEEANGYGFGWGIVQDPELGLVVRHSGGWPGYSTWFERFVDADRVLIILKCRSYSDARGFEYSWEGMRDIARGREPKPLKTVEDLEIKDPDRSCWESYCGRYEHEGDEAYLDEVFMKDGDLYGRIRYEESTGEWFEHILRLYPVGEKEFMYKTFDTKLSFGDGCVTYYEKIHKKL